MICQTAQTPRGGCLHYGAKRRRRASHADVADWWTADGAMGNTRTIAQNILSGVGHGMI